MLREFLEKNVKDFNYRSFLIVELQLLILLMLLILFLRNAVGFYLFAGAQVILSVTYLYIILVQLEKESKEEFSRYIIFFLAVLVFVQVIWVIPAFLIKDFFYQYIFFIVALIGLLLFVLLFNLFFGRNYTKGKVLLSNGEMAVVEAQFDLLSFTNAGKYVVATDRKRNKGATVKVKIRKLLFYRKPFKIIE